MPFQNDARITVICHTAHAHTSRRTIHTTLSGRCLRTSVASRDATPLAAPQIVSICGSLLDNSHVCSTGISLVSLCLLVESAAYTYHGESPTRSIARTLCLARARGCCSLAVVCRCCCCCCCCCCCARVFARAGQPSARRSSRDRLTGPPATFFLKPSPARTTTRSPMKPATCPKATCPRETLASLGAAGTCR